MSSSYTDSISGNWKLTNGQVSECPIDKQKHTRRLITLVILYLRSAASQALLQQSWAHRLRNAISGKKFDVETKASYSKAARIISALKLSLKFEAFGFFGL